MNPPQKAALEAGQVVHVRGRRGVIDEPPSWDSQAGQHLVQIRYLDEEEPELETCLWEREPGAELIQTAGFPDIDATAPTVPETYRAYLDAVRWSTRTAFPDENDLFLTAPLRGSVLLHNYQLYPLYKSMLMPSVRMFIADDVGLGKTIEAGLVLSELIAQRGIRRVLVICPASLQIQWKDELEEKFHLDFTILDRDEVYNVKQQDPTANPWMFHQHIITSMDFLKRDDVLYEFQEACRKLVPEGSGRFPWDLAIVDEAHHFAPQPTGEDTQRMEMLREVLREFEHRLLLSATPHNGYTTSFTGLLQFLDPVRFQRTSSLDEETRQELRSVFIRRLKDDVNQEDPPPIFETRAPPKALHSWPTDPGQDLIRALRRYDQEIRGLDALTDRERNAMRFVRTIFKKRLLSSPYALARTWWAHREAHDETLAQTRLASGEAVEIAQHLSQAREETSDDVRADEIDRDASRAGGSVLEEHWGALADHAERVDAALEALGLPRAVVDTEIEAIERPVPDAKWDSFVAQVTEDGQWQPEDEDLPAGRVVVFTEFKDTQNYLVDRLRQEGVPEETIRTFSGGASFSERERIKEAFNDPSDPVNILVATDAASEGLNLQRTCRYVVHQDLPWNPLKIDQRVGRLDRHGQTEEVHSWHHILETVEEYDFLSKVSSKADQARSDLGRLAPLLESGVDDAMMEGDQADLDEAADSVDSVIEGGSDLEELGEASADRRTAYQRSREATERAREELDMTPNEMAFVLERALTLDGGSLEPTGDDTYTWSVPQSWEPHAATLRRSDGSRRRILFEGAEETIGADAVARIREREDVAIVGLSHPLLQHAIRRLRRFLWDPGQGSEHAPITKWTTEVPPDEATSAVISFLVTARNKRGEVVQEKLVQRTWRRADSGFEEIEEIPTRTGEGEATPPGWAGELEGVVAQAVEEMEAAARADLESRLDEQAADARESYEKWLDRSLDALEEAAKGGASREIERLEREIEKWEEKAAQQRLDPLENAKNQWELEQRRKEKRELETMTSTDERIEEQKEHVRWEAEKYLEDVLPERYSLDHVEAVVAGIRITGGL